MMEVELKRKRRKEARPSEIVAAALAVFSEKGFAAARTQDIAALAGISKGALYLYFPTKEDLFRAVVREAVVPDISTLLAGITAADLTFDDALRRLLPNLAEKIATTRLAAVAKMVISESGNFPELAQVWYDNVVQRAVGTLSGLIAGAQARGEIRAGDPRTHAFSIIGPMLMGLLWRETFSPISGDEIDLAAIGRQHAETVLNGLRVGERLR